jgi:hypothetical protein
MRTDSLCTPAGTYLRRSSDSGSMLAIQVFGEFRIVPAKRRRHVTLEMGLCKTKTRKEKVLETSRKKSGCELGEQESCGKEPKLLDGEAIDG